MAFAVLAIDHYNRTEYTVATFETSEAAADAIRQRVDGELEYLLKQGVKAEQLLDTWSASGTGYMILGSNSFSARAHAQRQAIMLIIAAEREAWWRHWVELSA
jgi:hypothetical protein